MKKKRVYILRVLMIVWILFGVESISYKSDCRALSKTDGYKALKKVMEEPGDAQISLNGNIVMRGTIHVRGRKWLRGNGYRIQRGTVSGKVFGGTLFSVEDGEFNMQNTIVTGGGESVKVYGRLVEVKKGTFILGKKSVLKDNCNNKRGEEGGGAVIVRRQGEFIMKGGGIYGNETVTEGAAVYIEGGSFQMKGGVIQRNKSRGIGAIEGFDGRGGAISNGGTMTISGGVLKNNDARSFLSGHSQYGGVGGMLYNRGSCVITGGTIINNTASYGGGAIYSDRNSILHIVAGNFKNNQADRGRTIFFCGKSCYLDLFLKSGELYTAAGSEIKWGNRTKVTKKVTKPEGKQKRKITWKGGEKKRVYYTGEKLGVKEILYGLQAECDGCDITKDIYIKRVSGGMGKRYKSDRTFFTNRPCQGTIVFSIKREKAENKELTVPYVIRENQPPRVRTAVRYLFTWEVNGHSEERLKKMLRDGISISDAEDQSLTLWERADIDWGKLREGKAGTYKVKVCVRDQWGHRFYMNKLQNRRYGRGKVTAVEIPITLVAEQNLGSAELGAVRFLPPGNETAIKEEWYFPEELIVQIRAHMKTYKNPFSETANNDFLKRFGFAKRQSVSGGSYGDK